MILGNIKIYYNFLLFPTIDMVQVFSGNSYLVRASLSEHVISWRLMTCPTEGASVLKVMFWPSYPGIFQLLQKKPQNMQIMLKHVYKLTSRQKLPDHIFEIPIDRFPCFICKCMYVL